MKWGVFESDDEVHSVPINVHQEPFHPHVLNCLCPCHPQFEQWDKLLVVHNMIH